MRTFFAITRARGCYNGPAFVRGRIDDLYRNWRRRRLPDRRLYAVRSIYEGAADRLPSGERSRDQCGSVPPRQKCRATGSYAEATFVDSAALRNREKRQPLGDNRSAVRVVYDSATAGRADGFSRFPV